jgi:hypothetical protein
MSASLRLATGALVTISCITAAAAAFAGGTIKWIETDHIKLCGGGTQWSGCPPNPFGAPPSTLPNHGCPSYMGRSVVQTRIITFQY